MTELPKPPKAYDEFVKHFPKLGEAWDKLSEAGTDGPLPAHVARLVKLAIAVGAMREGAVRSNLRKATALGIPAAEIDQVVALAAGTIGLPSAVAVHSWIQDARRK